MRTDTSDKIIAYIKERKETTAKDLTDYLEISARAVFKQLKKLVDENKLVKYGAPPVVYYSLAPDESIKTESKLPIKIKNLLKPLAR
ncbi:MAG: winged helix-turn-helix domain-containing protein [Candidatus Falkowbacteria bacterium]